jgi:hypothetical protein
MALTRLRALAAHFTRVPHSAPSRAAGLASTTGAIHNDNAGCCTVPAVVSSYQPKGTYVPFAGFKHVYSVGPVGASLAIICIYDIFGCAQPSALCRTGAQACSSTYPADSSHRLSRVQICSPRRLVHAS